MIGGIQRHSFYLCKYLAQSGVKVDLYHTDKNRGPVKDASEFFTVMELENVRFFLIPYPKGIYFPGHYLWESYQYSKNLFQTFQHAYSSYDIIYVQGFSGWYLLKHRTRNPSTKSVCIVNMHGLEMFQQSSSFKNSLEQAMFRPFAKKQLLRGDYVQSLGSKLTEIIQSVGVPSEKILVMGIAIEGSWLRSSSPANKNSKTFVFVGRYEERKGISVLNKALRCLIAESGDFTFHFVGPIPEEHRVLHQNIVYHGLAGSNDTIISVLDRSDFLVVPSYSEGMPTVILEGMARGCGIITSDVGATQQLVSSKNGYLVKAGDSKNLYGALKSALELDGSSIGKMKRASFELVERKYIWESLIGQMISKFQKISKRETIA